MRFILYRHFDESGSLLYVGKTTYFHDRLDAHSKYSDWFDNVACISLEHFPCKESLCAAEKAAIEKESPAHNKMWNKNWVSPSAAAISHEMRAETLAAVEIILSLNKDKILDIKHSDGETEYLAHKYGVSEKVITMLRVSEGRP